MGKPVLRAKWRRFIDLRGADRRLLLRAVFWIGVARVWIAVLPFKQLATSLNADAGSADADPELLGRIGWAIGAAAANVPWRSDCFPKSIAAHKMLQTHGYASTIHLGVAKPGDGGSLAHAWVTCGDIVVTGEEQSGRYAEIHRLGEA